MSQNQTPHHTKHGRHLVNATSSVAAQASHVRFGTIQGARLPPFSSLFETGDAVTQVAAMDVDYASKGVNVNPSLTTASALKTLASSQGQSPHSRASIGSSKNPNHPISSSPLISLICHGQSVSEPQVSPLQNTPNSQCSPNTGPQPVGSTINLASNAHIANIFHVATMVDDQMVVNIAAETPKFTDNELVTWEPRKPSDGDSPCLPSKSLLEVNDRPGTAYRQLEDTVMRKQFPKRDAKKNKPSEGPNLAASLDDLAREHARSSISSSTISIPSSFSTRNGVQGTGDDHSRGCNASPLMDIRVRQGKDNISNECKFKIFEERQEKTCHGQSKNTAEPRNELDFLASVILSQNNPTGGECQQLVSESQAVSAARHRTPNANDSVSALAVPGQDSQAPNEGESEPRSEASFVLDDETPKPVLPQMVQALGQRSSAIPVHLITEESLVNMENAVSNPLQASVSQPSANEITRSVQVSSARIPAMAQLTTKVNNKGCVIAKDGKGYKLKRGPKSKKQKQSRVAASNGGKGRKDIDTVRKKSCQAGPSPKARTDSLQATKEDSIKHCHAANRNQDENQPNQKSSRCSGIVCSDPLSKASVTSRERTSLSDPPPNSTDSKKCFTRSPRLTRDGNSPQDKEEPAAGQDNNQENRQLSNHKLNPPCDNADADPSCALAVMPAVQSESEPNSSRIDQVSRAVENLLVQLGEEHPSTNVPADAEAIAAPLPIPLDVIIAAAKQSPPYVHKCEQCGSVFNRRFNLNKHIRNVHENIRKFACTTCGELFLQKSHLTAHILAVHKKSRPFHCELCPKRFSWIGVLRKHMQAIHKVTLQRKTIRKNSSAIPTDIDGNIGTIHPTRTDGKDVANASIFSSAQREMMPPAAGIVVAPQTSVPVHDQHQRTL